MATQYSPEQVAFMEKHKIRADDVNVRRRRDEIDRVGRCECEWLGSRNPNSRDSDECIYCGKYNSWAPVR